MFPFFYLYIYVTEFVQFIVIDDLFAIGGDDGCRTITLFVNK
jgi:hypothetical protein